MPARGAGQKTAWLKDVKGERRTSIWAGKEHGGHK